VHREQREFVVVESGAAQLRVVEVEAERADQVQPCAAVRAQADDVARVGRDLGFDQYDVKQISLPASSVVLL